MGNINKPTNIVTKISEMPGFQWKAWAKNLLKFTAPVLSIFFAQLALGVEMKPAALVALFGLYGALADLFKKASE